MAAPAPPRQPIQIARPGGGQRTGGVLAIAPSVTKGGSSNSTKPPAKNTLPRLKVIVRRLPPGLTHFEFDAVLGEEWKLGEKVDWVSYIGGKISKDPAKPSRPSRAYLHLTKSEYLAPLSDRVRNASFVDSKGSNGDSCLLGPPTVEFSPCGKVPTGKPRKDARQGTIDQEQDFKDFLQELTAPIPKPVPVDSVAEKPSKPEEKIITPLVQYLKDKKANKGKEGSSSKSGKHARQESKDNKASASEKKASKGKEGSGEKKGSNSKVEKAPREGIKLLSKQTGAKAASAQNPPTGPSAAGTTNTATSAQAPPKPERKRERGSASAAAKILQRDLGLNGTPPGRRKRESAASAAASPAAPKEPAAKASGPNTQASASAPASSPSASAPPTGPKAAQAPTGPAATRNQQKSSQGAAQSKQPPTAPSVNPTATQAFLKHANPSQGVTEPLLNEAFSAYGEVTKVEIDKKKGFAYIDFAEPEGLQKAIAASPVKVGQGQVVVLERKTGASLQNRNAKSGSSGGTGRGGSMNSRGGRGGRGRGGKGATDSGSTKNAPATASATAPTTAPTNTTTSSSTTTASTPVPAE